jgi:hypothetical protein
MRRGRLPIVLGVCVAAAAIASGSLAALSRPTPSTAANATATTTPAVALTVTRSTQVDATRPGTAPPTVGATSPGATSTTEASGGPTPSASGSSTSDFDVVDQATARFLTRDARWQVPNTLDVDQTTRIGLAIGSGPALTSGIKNLLPSTGPISAGTVQVGPTVWMTLRADPDDAIVTPSDKISASTGSDIQMLWTWLVHPIHPTAALLLTADIELPLDNGYVIRNEFVLSLQVQRTLSYTARQIFTNWATWSAIGATGIGVVSWLLRRKRRGPPSRRAGGRRRRIAADKAEQDHPEPQSAA